MNTKKHGLACGDDAPYRRASKSFATANDSLAITPPAQTDTSRRF